MADRSRTIESEFSRYGSLYFNFEPDNKAPGIAYVQRVTDTVFLDINRINGSILGIEIPDAFETLTGVVNPDYLISLQRGEGGFR